MHCRVERGFFVRGYSFGEIWGCEGRVWVFFRVIVLLRMGGRCGIVLGRFSENGSLGKKLSVYVFAFRNQNQ